MAIKVNGTTVINDSRVLSDVTGLKTVGGTSILGSGNIDAGASTDLGAVGTYILAMDTSAANSATGYKAGRTVAGSNLKTRGNMEGYESGNTATSTSGTSGLSAIGSIYYYHGYLTDNNSWSGSWRSMSTFMRQSAGQSNWKAAYSGLWVRYS